MGLLLQHLMLSSMRVDKGKLLPLEESLLLGFAVMVLVLLGSLLLLGSLVQWTQLLGVGLESLCKECRPADGQQSDTKLY
jgi:hypothetical protein